MKEATSTPHRQESWRRTLDVTLHPYETEVARLDRAWAGGEITDAEFDALMAETGRRFQRALRDLVEMPI